MNIDVREYLRINPISVHDLTLSGNGTDCFLIFGNGLSNGYMAITQNAIFRTLYQMIFGNLLKSDLSGFNLSNTNPPTWNVCNLVPSQFSNYVRRNGSDNKAYIPYKNAIESWLSLTESLVESKIWQLRTTAKTWSKGAVEYKANSSTPYYDYNDTYYERLRGITWCYNQTGEDISGTGRDQVEMSEPIKHRHEDSRAETLTVPYSTKKGGGELIADFGLGVKDMVSYSNWVKASSTLTPKQEMSLTKDDELTQPLYGQNILDWRNRQRTHNNIPPVSNVFAMRIKKDITSIHAPLVSRSVLNAVDARDEVVEDDIKPVSYVAAQYYSSKVCDLDDYGEADLTTHDYLLRVLHSNGEAIELMKQTVQMLLDIFGEQAFDTLSIKDANGNLIWSMEDILKLKLDELLVPKYEFAGWYNDIVDRMSKLNDRLQLYRQMLISIKPLNYVGRIVMTSTDDTEQKVIKHHGGKKWRRIVNFLRGVGEWSELGTKLGEEYVCLRESNIPVHTHALASASSPEAEKVWQMKKDAGSNDTKTVDVGQTNGGIKLQNRTLDYQISPLEYEQMDVILPHDNMPPYREVYFWECLDPTDEELGMYVITWDSNCDLTSPEPYYRRYNEPTGRLPNNFNNSSRPGYSFVGWFDDEGNEADPHWKVTKSVVYHAKWDGRIYTITFNHNNGETEEGDFTETRARRYGETVGITPEPRRPNVDLEMKRIKFDGWFNSKTGGTQITKDTTVTGNATYYAHWNISTIEHPVVNVTFDATGGTFSNNAGTMVIQRNWGTNVGTLPVSPAKSHYIFDGWWTKTKSGTRVTSNTTVNEDVTFYAHWIPSQFTITYDLRDGVLPAGKSNPTSYNSDTKAFTLVNPQRTGYVFLGWSGTEITGTQVRVTIPRGSSGNRSYAANWKTQDFVITYNMNGHGLVPSSAKRSYTIEDPTYTPPDPDHVIGYTFTGWTPDSIPQGSTGDKRFSAGWTVNVHTATFDPNGGDGETTTKTQDYGTPLYAPEVSRTGYDLTNWEPEVPLTMPDEDCVFVAQWQPKVYTITFDANGGERTITVDEEYGTTLTPPEVQYPGFNLIGWFTEQTGGTEIEGDITVTGTATYYAHWEIIVYNVAYDTDHVEVEVPATQDYPRTHTVLDQITPPPLSGDYYPSTFIQWSPVTMPVGTAADQTFVAQWNTDKATITFNANGGILNGDSTRILDIGEFVGEAPEVERDEYYLVGWYDNIEGGEELTEDTEVLGDKTYYARWIKATYTITFRDNIPLTISYDRNY